MSPDVETPKQGGSGPMHGYAQFNPSVTETKSEDKISKSKLFLVFFLLGFLGVFLAFFSWFFGVQLLAL